MCEYYFNDKGICFALPKCNIPGESRLWRNRNPYLLGRYKSESILSLFNYLIDNTQKLDVSDYKLVQWLQIDTERTYELIILHEEDMRKNMYKPRKQGLYLDPLYGLLELNFETPIHTGSLIDSPDILTWKVLQKTFSTFSDRGGILSKIKGVFIAGGYILSRFLDFDANDIDIFLITSDVQEADKIICEVHKAITTDLRFPPIITRTKNSITYSTGLHPKIQIILRLYRTPSEVLHGFDVDCCAVGYWQGKFYMTQRAAYALRRGYNTVNLNRLSPSYEHRLLKYLGRGFGIKIPGFDKTKITLEKSLTTKRIGVFRKEISELHHLDVLIYGYINGINWKAQTTEKQEQPRKRKAKKKKAPTPLNKFILNEVCKTEASDYAVLIPKLRILDVSSLLWWLWSNLDTHPHPELAVDLFRMRKHDVFPNRKNIDEHSYAELILTEHEQKLVADCTEDMCHLKEIASKLEVNGLSKRLQSTWFVSSQNLDLILKIDERIARILSHIRPWDLPRTVEYKQINPGVQTTSTFNKIILEDPHQWWVSKYYCI